MKVLVIADIHGNANALAAVLEKERDADRTLFLGDAVLPGPQANETIALLKDMAPGTHIAGLVLWRRCPHRRPGDHRAARAVHPAGRSRATDE